MKFLKLICVLMLACVLFAPLNLIADQDYDAWYQNHEWLMLKSEKKAFQKANTEAEKMEVIREFYKARDPNRFTFKNEFKLQFQRNLNSLPKKYSGKDDVRRYVHLLFGSPDTIKTFSDEVLNINYSIDFRFRIRVNRWEVWRYNFQGQAYEVIFAKLSPSRLEWFRRQPEDNVSMFAFSSSELNILYAGPERFTDIQALLDGFFRGAIGFQANSDIINSLTRNVTECAQDYYKNPKPAVRENKYSQVWKKGFQVLINQFEIDSPNEVGISIWIVLDKNSLHLKKRKYVSDLSLYCEFKNMDNRRLIQYRDDQVEYKFKNKKHYYYHFWGSLPAGEYKFSLEVGDNIGKKYTRIAKFKSSEEDVEKESTINIVDYSKEGLKVSILVGKLLKDKQRVKGNADIFSFKNGILCPATKTSGVKNNDDFAILFDISGLKTNNRGFCYLELAVNFTRMKRKKVVRNGVEKEDFVSTGESYTISVSPIEEKKLRLRRLIHFNANYLINNYDLQPGFHFFKVCLLITDRITNYSCSKNYSRIVRVRNEDPETAKD